MSNIIRWEPFRDIMSLRQAMDKLFADSFVTPSRPPFPFQILQPLDK